MDLFNKYFSASDFSFKSYFYNQSKVPSASLLKELGPLPDISEEIKTKMCWWNPICLLKAAGFNNFRPQGLLCPPNCPLSRRSLLNSEQCYSTSSLSGKLCGDVNVQQSTINSLSLRDIVSIFWGTGNGLSEAVFTNPVKSEANSPVTRDWRMATCSSPIISSPSVKVSIKIRQEKTPLSGPVIRKALTPASQRQMLPRKKRTKSDRGRKKSKVSSKRTCSTPNHAMADTPGSQRSATDQSSIELSWQEDFADSHQQLAASFSAESPTLKSTSYQSNNSALSDNADQNVVGSQLCEASQSSAMSSSWRDDFDESEPLEVSFLLATPTVTLKQPQVPLTNSKTDQSTQEMTWSDDFDDSQCLAVSVSLDTPGSRKKCDSFSSDDSQQVSVSFSLETPTRKRSDDSFSSDWGDESVCDFDADLWDSLAAGACTTGLHVELSCQLPSNRLSNVSLEDLSVSEAVRNANKQWERTYGGITTSPSLDALCHRQVNLLPNFDQIFKCHHPASFN